MSSSIISINLVGSCLVACDLSKKTLLMVRVLSTRISSRPIELLILLHLRAKNVSPELLEKQIEKDLLAKGFMFVADIQ